MNNIELIFPEIFQRSNKKTNIILNISEDGWFGKSIGPHQHFAKSIFRAIENNTFLLRSANQGISAIIDNKGNTIKKMNINMPQKPKGDMSEHPKEVQDRETSHEAAGSLSYQTCRLRL